MRVISSFVFLLLVAVGGIRAQEPVLLADRGPRFLVASTVAGEPTIVDARDIVVLRQRISLDLEGVTLEEALTAISRKAGLRLMYSKAVVPLESRVRLQAKGITVAGALTEVLFDAGVDVLLTANGQAVLTRRTESAKLGGQGGSIIGRVTEVETGKGIGDVEVLIEGTRWRTLTAPNGQYRLVEVDTGGHVLVARRIGYTKRSRSVVIVEGQEVTANFALEKSVQPLDELVTVTPGGGQTKAEALPSPVTVITADEIAAQAPRNVQELFRQAVPGAVSWDQTGRPATAVFAVRGASTLNPGNTQMKVFVDGIQVADALNNFVDPRNIDRIEVIRGPQAAAIYGSDAIGGVVQIFTKRGDAGSAPRVQGEVSYGLIQTGYPSPEGAVRQEYSTSVRGGTTDITYNVGARYWRNGNWVPPADELSAQSSPSVFGAVRFTRGIASLDISGQYGVINTGLALSPEFLTTGYVPYSQPQYTVSREASTNLSAQVTVRPLPWWFHSVRAGFNDADVFANGRQPRFTTPDDSLVSAVSALSTRRWIGYTTTIAFEPMNRASASLTAGFDHNSLPAQVVLASSASPQDPTFLSPFAFRLNTHNTGYFLQGQLGVHDDLFLSGGLRAEQNTNFGDSLGTPVSPRIGLSYVRALVGATVKLRGSWGRAIRAPDPGFRLLVGPDVLPNPQLAPERQRGWDAGIDAQFGTWGVLGLTYYDQLAENLIQFVPLQTTSGVVNQFQNVGRVKNRGIEVEATLRAGWLDVRGTYAYTRARIEDLGPNYTGDLVVGAQVRETPKHTAGALLSATPLAGTTVAAGVAYVGSFSQVDNVALFRCLGGTGPCTEDFQFVTTHSGFAKLNLGVTQRLSGGLSALLQVDNLTNNTSGAERAFFIPVMGRITTVGLRLGT